MPKLTQEQLWSDEYLKYLLTIPKESRHEVIKLTIKHYEQDKILEAILERDHKEYYKMLKMLQKKMDETKGDLTAV
jgi:hypothetical protein